MKTTLLTILLFISAGCRTIEPTLPPPADAPQIHFLLTYDDGPCISEKFNPTLAILDQLETNDIQPGIKALFFVQTEHPRGGGPPLGRDIMHRIHSQGHVLGIHSVSAKGHISHISQPSDELITELNQAKTVLRNITGSDPLFVRPPFGACDLRTRTIYDQLNLKMLMSNVRAKDGVIYFYNWSLRRRSNIFKALQALQKISAPGGKAIAVINFHDTNPYTARHMTEYLHILVEEAQHAGFAVPEAPFCASQHDVERAAIAQQVPPPARTFPQHNSADSTN